MRPSSLPVFHGTDLRFPREQQTCAIVPLGCEDASHQREEAQQFLACLVSVKTVPVKIWNQKGSLNIATFAEYTRTLCTQTRYSTCRVRLACRRHNCSVSRRDHCRVSPSSCGGMKTPPRTRQRGIQSSLCSTQQERPAGE